jgi:hypothetical protein
MNPTTLVGIHRTLVAPSQSINYAGYPNVDNAGDLRPRIVFRVPKIGSHFAGKLSEIRIRLAVKGGSAFFYRAIVAQSLWNFVKQFNIYIGQTKVLGVQDAYVPLMVNERLKNHPSMFYDTCAYYSGWNDKVRSNIYALADGTDIEEANYRDDTNQFFGIGSTALNPGQFPDPADPMSLDFVIPLTELSDIFLQDIPLHLLDKQDITMELFLDLTNTDFGLRSGSIVANFDVEAVGLKQAELYCVSYTEPFEIIQQQRSVAIPFTNIVETISPAGDAIRNFQFSIARQKLKKMIIALYDDQDPSPYLGRCISQFVTQANNESYELQIRYNDKLYFPEDVRIDSRLYSYANDCSLFGSACIPAGHYDFTDSIVLTGNIDPLACGADLNTLITDDLGLNFAIMPFSLVEMNSVLANNLSLVGEMINDKPILITLKANDTTNYSTRKLFVHCETQRVMTITPNDVMVVSA